MVTCTWWGRRRKAPFAFVLFGTHACACVSRWGCGRWEIPSKMTTAAPLPHSLTLTRSGLLNVFCSYTDTSSPPALISNSYAAATTAVSDAPRCTGPSCAPPHLATQSGAGDGRPERRGGRTRGQRAVSPPLFLFGFILMVVLKQTLEVKNRGYGFLIPIGKILTQHEEKNDVRIFFLFQPVCAACDSTRRIGLLNLRSSPLLFDNWCSLGSQPT